MNYVLLQRITNKNGVFYQFCSQFALINNMNKSQYAYFFITYQSLQLMGSSTETVAFQLYEILKIDHEFLQFF